MSNVDWKILGKWFGDTRALARKPDPLIMAERGRASAAKRKALKLLEQYPSIDAEKDRQGGWWVTCEDFDETNDPADGAHWCSDWFDVLDAVEVYVEHINAKAA